MATIGCIAFQPNLNSTSGTTQNAGAVRALSLGMQDS